MPAKKVKNKFSGLSIIEVNIAMVLIGVFAVFLGSMFVLINKSAVKVLELSRATELASGMMEEVKIQRWDEINGGESAVLGKDTGETNNKTTFDDVDDFNNYMESPPLYPDGAPMDEFGQYSRRISVFYVDENVAVSTSTTFRKLVTIEILKEGTLLYKVNTIISQK